jgi:tetratricopeptide (TPR) repeat protein
MNLADQACMHGLAGLCVFLCVCVAFMLVWHDHHLYARTHNIVAALNTGNLDEAEKHFKEAINKKFDHPKTRYYYGLMLQNQRKDPAAAEALWRQVSMFQLKSRFHVQLLSSLAALLIEYKNDYDEAEKCYKLALDCDPLHVNTMVNYGTHSPFKTFYDGMSVTVLSVAVA